MFFAEAIRGVTGVRDRCVGATWDFVRLWWCRVVLFLIWLLHAKGGECGGTLGVERRVDRCCSIAAGDTNPFAVYADLLCGFGATKECTRDNS